MRGRILFILLFQVAQVESLEEVNGYLGDSVTLPSGGNPSWKLSKIKWSIFPNNTFIATYRNYTKNTDRLSRYKGRLDLNTSSGDLTICNLTRDDDMEYTVDLIDTEKNNIVNKIKLTVLKHLQRPTIERIPNTPSHEHCFIKLRCTSTDEGVDFSWEVKPDSVPHASNRDGNSGVLSAYLSSPQTNITCISSNNKERTSSSVSPKCDDRKPQPQPLPRDRFGLHGFIALVAALIIMLIPITIWKGGEGSSNSTIATGGPAELEIVHTLGTEQKLSGGEGSSNSTAELEIVDTSGTEQRLSEKLCPAENSS
ncbi:CD48 antigen [Scomber scombrus]|uniref:CD48 antigen n=1 Tax=Scomber scombrus TaxID=13677 RepID=UPI002DDAD75E|nr:CD48 antigen [Scomber scombrus]